jgi:ankyrin repeat protein
MLNFREWLLINETKEEKALASELAGDALVDLSTVIPQNNKNADKLLLLAAYYYSQTKDKEQVKTDMTAYIGYLNRDKMKLITVDLNSKKPPSPWDDYLHWTEVIHTHQADDADKEKSKFRPSDIDFQNEKPILTSPDGQIKVYESNNTEKCIILGKGQSFCISKPGNKMWQTYRDSQTSTFYFVYDDTRDDRLSIVVVDARPNTIVLTDKVNDTGTTLDPYTGKLTYDSKPYMKYLKEKGIDVSKIVNIPKSEEEERTEKLAQGNSDFDWFKSLSPDYKSKYIGRGHLLTDEQFDYLWENKFTSLLTQYVKTGLRLNDHQLDKIVTNRDLKDNYLHNRLIADQQRRNLTKKEYALLNRKQKESYYGNMHDDIKLPEAIKFDDLEFFEYLVKNGAKIGDNAVIWAARTGSLALVKYLVEKGAKIHDYAVIDAAIMSGNLALVEYLVKNGAKIGDNAVDDASKTGNLELVEYLVKNGAKISNDAVNDAARIGNLDIVEYLVKNGAEISNYAVIDAAIMSGNLALVKYLVENGGKISHDAVNDASKTGNLELVEYLVKNGAKISNNALMYAAMSGDLALVTYFIEEKGVKIDDNAIISAASNDHLHIVKYLVGKNEEKGKKISYVVFLVAIRNNILNLVKYLVEEKGFKVTDNEIEDAKTNYSGDNDMIDYLNSVKERE